MYEQFGKIPNLLFNQSLHRKIWTYIANNLCTEITAATELETENQITLDEFKLFRNSFKLNICCEYALNDNLNQDEINKFYHSNDPEDNFEVCFKHCPLKLYWDRPHLCYNGLYDDWFNMWDYDYDEKYEIHPNSNNVWKDYMFIFDRQKFYDIAMEIANMPLRGS